MMREILFRAFYRELGLSSPFSLGGFPSWNGETLPYWATRCKIEQFIGLTDKNGNKIFEGDIIRDEDSGARGKVFLSSDSTSGYCTWFLGDGYNCSLSFLDSTNIEIIGNIQDNPELLT
jgi:hypothetical protein